MNLSPSIFHNDEQRHLNLWWQGSLFIMMFLSINILLYTLDTRLLADEALWIKPIKFEISIIIHFITLAVLATLLSPSKRNSKLWKAMTYIVITAGLFEVMYIFIQAARERESHYNHATIVESVMYGLMGLGAIALVFGSFYLGYLLYREYQSKSDNVLLLSSALGLIIGSVLTMIIAGYLSSLPTGYAVDAVEQVSVLRLPIFSWYLNGQDIRIPHFFATHMMQLIPFYGFWLSRKKLTTAECKTRLYWGVGSYSLIVILLFTATFF